MWKMAILGVLLGSLQSLAGETVPAEELVKAQRVNQQMRASIFSIYAQIEFDKPIRHDASPPPIQWPTQIKWWQDNQKIRFHETTNRGEVQESVYVDGVFRDFRRRKSSDDGKHRTGTITSAGQVKSHYSTIYSIWKRGLFDHPYYTAVKPVSAFLDSKVFKTATYAQEGNIRSLEITHDVPNSQVTCEMLFLPHKSYSASRVAIFGPFGKASEIEVEKFRECAAGIWFPEKVIARNYEKGHLAGETHYRFSIVNINIEIPASVFDLTYPENTLVIDRTRQIAYKTDAKGQPTEERPFVNALSNPNRIGYPTNDNRSVTPWYKRWYSIVAMTVGAMAILYFTLRVVRRVNGST